MLELNEQTPAAAPITQLLRGAETEFCRLRSQREAVEIALAEPSPERSSLQVDRLRVELRSLDEQMAHCQIEQLEHRISLAKAHLPADREAVAPAQTAFQQANNRYLEAARAREIAAWALDQAQRKVGFTEESIRFYSATIEELKKQLERKGRPELAAGELESELTSIEKRLGRLKTISSQLSAG
jgi:chromosome segregation ATPase